MYTSKTNRCPDLIDDGKRKGNYSINVDVYDFGTIIYELATGIAFNWQESDISKVRIDYTLELEDFVLKTTEPDNTKRISIESLLEHDFIAKEIEE